MPFCAIGWAFKQKGKADEKLVLVMLADCANQDGFGLVPIHELLELCGMTDYRFRKSIAALNRKPSLLHHAFIGSGEEAKIKYQINWSIANVVSSH